ncbi:MAG: hypothetical protein V3U71_13640 [Cocleimonas sp.]
MKNHINKFFAVLGFTILTSTATFAAPGDIIPVLQILLLEDDSTPIGNKGTSISLTGSISSNDKRWERLSETCTSDGNTANHYYDSFQITNNTGTPQKIEIFAQWVGGNNGDGYLHLATDNFTPSNAISSCITGDDDFNGFTGSLIPGGTNTAPTINPGQVLTIIASTFTGNQAIGNYTITVSTLSE